MVTSSIAGQDLTKTVWKFQQDAEENSQSLDAQMGLFFALMALDGYEQAIKVLDRVIDIDVNFAEGHYWLGRINYIQERFEVAAPSFLTAVSLAPEWSGAYTELGLCYFRMHK